MARLTWEQTAGGTVRTARSTRGNTGTRAGPNGAIGRITYRLDPRDRPTAPGNRVARGGTQGGLNCLTHALPRCLPTPTEEADGNGYGVITGRGGPSRPPPRVSVNLVPLLWTGVRHHPPGRTDKNMCRCFCPIVCTRRAGSSSPRRRILAHKGRTSARQEEAGCCSHCSARLRFTFRAPRLRCPHRGPRRFARPSQRVCRRTRWRSWLSQHACR